MTYLAEHLSFRGLYYAQFHGRMDAMSSVLIKDCLFIKHDGDYRAMFDDLQDRIKIECDKLGKQLRSVE